MSRAKRSPRRARSARQSRGLCLWVAACILGASMAQEVWAADEADDRFEPWAYIGEVNNRFAANRRLEDGRDDDEKNRIDRVAGIGFDYTVFRNKSRQLQVDLSGQTVHSARTVVADTSSSGAQLLSVLRDGDVFEALASIRVLRALRFVGDKVAAGIYLKAQGGFIRTDAAADDVLDNHFLGIGVEHMVGPYEGSLLEVGIGRTELFENTPGRDYRKDRFKVGASLNYTPGIRPGESEGGLPVGLYAEMWFDSDIGPGSDDLQLYMGLFFDIAKIFEAYSGNHESQ